MPATKPFTIDGRIGPHKSDEMLQQDRHAEKEQEKA